MSELLDSLPGVWRGAGRQDFSGQSVIPSNIKELDKVLPNGGWPRGALVEILSTNPGVGELKLILPTLTGFAPAEGAGITASADREAGWIVWVSPPFVPFAPALAQAGFDLDRLLLVSPRRDKQETRKESRRTVLWSTEQALRSGDADAVLAWIDDGDDRTMRRLQLAAAEGDALGFLFRSLRQARQSSPAAIRLRIDSSDDTGQVISLLKCRGGRPVSGIRLP